MIHILWSEVVKRCERNKESGGRGGIGRLRHEEGKAGKYGMLVRAQSQGPNELRATFRWRCETGLDCAN